MLHIVLKQGILDIHIQWIVIKCTTNLEGTSKVYVHININKMPLF